MQTGKAVYDENGKLKRVEHTLTHGFDEGDCPFCAGLNPAAYRECVEALKVVLEQAEDVWAQREHPKGKLEDAICEGRASLHRAEGRG